MNESNRKELTEWDRKVSQGGLMSDRDGTFLQRWWLGIFAAVVLLAAGGIIAAHLGLFSRGAGIIGQWRDVSSSEQMVFLKGGAFYSVTAAGVRMAGTYVILDKGTIKLEYGGVGGMVGPVVVPISISGDELTFDPHGAPTQYRREK